MYTRETIDKMNSLSLEVFGTKSKWRKFMDKGDFIHLTEDTKKLTIDEETKKEKYETVQTPVMHVGKNGGEVEQMVIKRYTLEEVEQVMLYIQHRNKMIAEMVQKQKAEHEAKQEAAKVVSQATGSSGGERA